MRSGRLRHRIAIQAVTESRDANTGEVSESWATAATVWGAITPTSGGETWRNLQVQPTTTHVVEIRHYSGLTPRHRLQYDSRTLEIMHVTNVEERGRTMLVQCKEMD